MVLKKLQMVVINDGKMTVEQFDNLIISQFDNEGSTAIVRCSDYSWVLPLIEDVKWMSA